MKEKYINLKMIDGGEISGRLSELENNKIIIFVHGLTGNSGEVQFYEAKKYFPKRGYDTLSLDLYSFEEKDKRFLWNTSIEQHTKDLENVIRKFSKKYNKIFLVGHSIGGPVIYLSDYINKSKKVKSACLWEPTINPKNVENDFIYDKRLKKYFSFGYFMSKKFVNELMTLKSGKISKFRKPLKIILNKNGILVENWKEAFNFIKVDYEVYKIKDSNHDFSNNNSMNILLRETKKFFDNF